MCFKANQYTSHSGSVNLYRHIKRRVRCSLMGTIQGEPGPSRKQVAHKLSGAKGIFLGPTRVPRPQLEPNSAHSYRQYHSGCLYKQGRRHEVRPSLGPTVENSYLVLRETGDS